MTAYLSVRQAMMIAQLAVGPDVQVADRGLLASALIRPSMSVFGEDAYPSLERKAAALLESLARNHALVDGNKRLAWAATKTFLRINGFKLWDRGDAYEFMLGVAAEHLTLEDIEIWIGRHLSVI